MTSTPQAQALFEAARAVRERAHVPYSKFKVGAALMDETGRIHAGCNIENASYPEGWCAETSAISHLIAAGGKRIIEACVVGEGDRLCTPCGGCRQRLAEFADWDVTVHIANREGIRRSFTVKELLPAGFELSHDIAETSAAR